MSTTIDPITGEVTVTGRRGTQVTDGEIDNTTGFITLTVGTTFRALDGTVMREVRMRFLRDQLLYDIKNNAYIEYDVLENNEDSQSIKKIVADICEKGNVDRVNRILMLVFAEIENLLYPCTKEPVEDEEMDDNMEEPASYEMLLHVPNSTSRVTLRLLVNLIHEFMVCRVLADWLATTHTKAAETWAAKAQFAREQIERAKPIQRSFKRKISPF